MSGEDPIAKGASHNAHPRAVNGMNTTYMTHLAPSPVAMAATARSSNHGPHRLRWFDDYSHACVPGYLTGECLREYGWDTAGLAVDSKTVDRYCETEVSHVRWAMLGTLGCFTHELLTNYPGVPIVEPIWVKPGAQILYDGGLDGLGSSRLTHAPSIFTIPSLHVERMTGAEAYCIMGGSLCGAAGLYHGGAFDPLGLADDPTWLLG